MGITLSMVGVQAYDFKKFLYSFQTFPCTHTGMDQQRLADDILDFHTGIQRTVWILEDHLDIFTQRTHFFFTNLCNVLAVKPYFSGIRYQKVVDQPSGGRLSTAGLTYQGEGFLPA